MALKKYVKHFFKVIYLHSVLPLSTEGLNLLPNFQKRGPDRISTFRGCWKRGVSFFSGGEGLQILHKKKKLKSEMLNDQKEIYKQKYLPAITKNLN